MTEEQLSKAFGDLAEPIRIGISIELEMARKHGFWRRKNESKGVGMSFSSTLLEISGGVEKLLAEWELVPW